MELDKKQYHREDYFAVIVAEYKVNVAGPCPHHLTGPHIHDFGVWSITAQLRRLERIAPATGKIKMNDLTRMCDSKSILI